MDIRKIVITGGPCGGKTTAMSWIMNHFTTMGFKVLFVPETATELIGGGVCPWTCGTNLDYQKIQCRLQQTKELLFEQAAQTMPDEKILIVCDRGILDNRAYMNDEEFNAVLEDLGSDIESMFDQYDAVFHLVTAAKGAESFYTLENNAARYETAEQARELDDRLIGAWTGHPHFKIIDNSTGFDEKLRKLINEMILFLGEPRTIGGKKRFLIRKPDMEWLENKSFSHRVEIVETFITSPKDEECIIHQRGDGEHFVCYETIRKVVNGKLLELEKRLTEDQYLDLLEEADPDTMPIHKTRYYLYYKQQYFELDLYPDMEDEALIETEVSDQEDPVELPPELTVIRDVSGTPEYRRKNLAKKI